MDYRDADDECFAIVEAHGSEVFGAGVTSKLPETMRALAMFCAKGNSLKTAMFDAIDSDNPYAFRVLYRCFCEHLLKFMYLWVRSTKEKTDAVGTEYYSYCGAIEAFEYGAALKAAEALIGNKATGDFTDAVATLYPKSSALTRKELEAFSGKFKYRTILRYLAEPDIGFVVREHPFLAAIVPAYALYSSFVHGGPYSELEMATYAEPKALADCERDAGVMVMMNATMFMLTAAAVAAAKGEKVAPVAGMVRDVLRRFSEANDEEDEDVHASAAT